MGNKRQELLRKIPAVTVILQNEQITQLIDQYSHHLVVEYINLVVQDLRSVIVSDAEVSKDFIESCLSIESIAAEVRKGLDNRWSAHLKRVINATGVVLHTNLGRATLSKSAIAAVVAAAANYSNLELDLDTGKRGSRYDHVEDIICRLTGAEAALVVNNNAAAVLLVLNTIAKDKEVVVSRGQLVEIGGSFRIPEVMRQSGARLVEVGATNKTHLRDFAQAICGDTAALLRVHTSNYRIIGFTQEVSLAEMVALAEQHEVPVLDDLGSGVLIDFTKYGLPAEPTVQASVTAGASIVTFSGDKLLGGPQAGIIAGKAKYIEQIKKNQLTRALRVDKMTLAALEATLRLYLDEEKALKEIPTLHMLTLNPHQITERVEALRKRIKENLSPWYGVTVAAGFSQVGGGSLPEEDLPTVLLALEPKQWTVSAMEPWLRKATIPVMGRIYRDELLLDLRTVQATEDDELFATLKWVAEQMVKEVIA